MSDLPEPGSPLTLADGTQIDPRNGNKVRGDTFIEVPRHSEMQEVAVAARKKLVDLPDAPEKMNIVSVIAAYHLFGLEDAEIAVALQVSVTQIERIRELDTFTGFVETLISEIRDRDADQIRGMLSDGARKAAKRVRDHLDSEDDSVSLAAARDLLDRDGHSAKHIVEHRHSLEGGLTIRYVDGRNEAALQGVTIDAAQLELMDACRSEDAVVPEDEADHNR